jgi:hypothetical protein
VPDLVLDPTRSRVRIQTFAEGLFARLAHDLELVASGLSGTASRTSDGVAAGGTAAIEASLSGLSVAGVLEKNGRVDDRGLTPNERRDCIAKMLDAVFHATAAGVVHVAVQFDAGTARIRVMPPSGKAVEVVVRPEVRSEADAIHATGTFDISLMAIGSSVVKGPMGAFRVKDRVKVIFEVVFAAPRAT